MAANYHYGDFQLKMQEAGLSDAAMKAFKNSYDALLSGSSGMIDENLIEPVSGLLYLEGGCESIRDSVTVDPALLQKTVVLKLNGGLGTSMGLDKAKSLLNVKGDDTFIDLMVKQVIELRRKYDSNIKFVLMNSFSTSQDTFTYLQKYPEFANDMDLELLQNKVPKVDANTLKPVQWPANSSKEWCPPGHGDLYASLLGSGKLKQLLDQGFKYMFISNSDNLGATLDLDLLTFFAQSEKPFLMECCERTENDKKGGHLAVRKTDKQLILRESAQCSSSDEATFQDITRHRYFNTNNLWVRLDRLQEELHRQDSVLPLPMIKNKKTVDPKDSSSTPVFQLETAMGAAIECFQASSAVCVPRTRFVPVKKCNDLLLLRSDAYELTPDHRPVLACPNAPVINLDGKKFKFVRQLEAAVVDCTPSLVNCTRLTITGAVAFSKGVTFKGEVFIKNDSDEVKSVLPGIYDNTTLDVTSQPSLGPLNIVAEVTAPIEGQKPGTSGLRKKTRVFMEGNYLKNFVQATFDAIPTSIRHRGTLVISGDGRYYNDTAIQTIIKMAVAAGVRRIWLGQNGILSTPAVSTVIRERDGGEMGKAFGGFILTASHNPAGIDEDFGIKYNCENGGPALEKVTNEIFANTKTVSEIYIAKDFPVIDLSKTGTTIVKASDNSRELIIEVFDSAEDHANLLSTIFDFNAIRKLFVRKDFNFVYDCMNGVQGPYARRIFCDILGASPSCLMNADPKVDFGGIHADPNLTYAKDLIKVMCVDQTGQPVAEGNPPAFGAACDGDADRNMILGRRFFVTPSDSLAIIAANANIIPFFKNLGGLKGVARSMPTSGAVDLVARQRSLALFEVPTGWKFFGNLMDSAAVYGKEDYTPFICGEESFGTGSSHIREKDGMWAVLAWLNILASRNTDSSAPLVTVQDIVEEHWKMYGRNYYSRYDYEDVDKAMAQEMMQRMATMKSTEAQPIAATAGFSIKFVGEFTYKDPVDDSVSEHQGIRFLFEDGSRLIFRLSGTGIAGATIRMYIEKYEPPTGNLGCATADVLDKLIEVGLKLSQLESFTGRKAPTVVT